MNTNDEGQYVLPTIVKIYPLAVEVLVARIGKDKKLNCIKEARTIWNLGLREAKELIETVILPTHAYTQTIERTVYVVDEDEAWDKNPAEGIIVSIRKNKDY